MDHLGHMRWLLDLLIDARFRSLARLSAKFVVWRLQAYRRLYLWHLARWLKQIAGAPSLFFSTTNS